MLIVSKFHDYYDTAATYGIDKTVVFNRTTQDVKLPTGERLPHGERFWVKRPNTSADLSFFAVGFCGNTYPGAVVDREDGTDPEHFYNPLDLMEYLTGLGVAIDYKTPASRWMGVRAYKSGYTFNGKAIGNAFDPKPWSTYLDDKYRGYNSPILLVHRGAIRPTLTVNPILRTLHFQQMKDPATAFQDIYMYISGVLGVPTRQPIETSDEVRAAAKGHDGEYSFRKPPGKRGNPKWR